MAVSYNLPPAHGLAQAQIQIELDVCLLNGNWD